MQKIILAAFLMASLHPSSTQASPVEPHHQRAFTQSEEKLALALIANVVASIATNMANQLQVVTLPVRLIDDKWLCKKVEKRIAQLEGALCQEQK